nr:EOG090X0M4M [Lepidurus arcticus]
MSQKQTKVNGNGSLTTTLDSSWKRAFQSRATWPDKDEFLDVIYWTRQVLGLILGVVWGVLGFQGFTGLALFALINAGLLYLYCTAFQNIDEDEYGGAWELTKEGFMTSFAEFLVILFLKNIKKEVSFAKSSFLLWIVGRLDYFLFRLAF